MAGLVVAGGGARMAVPASQGYLLVDPGKCQGCQNCMAACSLAHHGTVNLSLARIQVAHDHLGKFPDDAVAAACRQCADPACLKACPVGALRADRAHGNVRVADPRKCTGCRSCVEACPYPLSRAIWNHEKARAEKCDLCVGARYWKARGGAGGRQACIEVCPVKAIAYTEKMPPQDGDRGYAVNLRGADWEVLGFSTGREERQR
jgi:protein NrfC